ncbi:hypothetical protein RI367_004520 [Sorochytrium milnesiophthora]
MNTTPAATAAYSSEQLLCSSSSSAHAQPSRHRIHIVHADALSLLPDLPVSSPFTNTPSALASPCSPYSPRTEYMEEEWQDDDDDQDDVPPNESASTATPLPSASSPLVCAAAVALDAVAECAPGAAASRSCHTLARRCLDANESLWVEHGDDSSATPIARWKRYTAAAGADPSAVAYVRRELPIASSLTASSSLRTLWPSPSRNRRGSQNSSRTDAHSSISVIADAHPVALTKLKRHHRSPGQLISSSLRSIFRTKSKRARPKLAETPSPTSAADSVLSPPSVPRVQEPPAPHDDVQITESQPLAVAFECIRGVHVPPALVFAALENRVWWDPQVDSQSLEAEWNSQTNQSTTLSKVHYPLADGFAQTMCERAWVETTDPASSPPSSSPMQSAPEHNSRFSLSWKGRRRPSSSAASVEDHWSHEEPLATVYHMGACLPSHTSREADLAMYGWVVEYAMHHEHSTRHTSDASQSTTAKVPYTRIMHFEQHRYPAQPPADASAADTSDNERHAPPPQVMRRPKGKVLARAASETLSHLTQYLRTHLDMVDTSNVDVRAACLELFGGSSSDCAIDHKQPGSDQTSPQPASAQSLPRVDSAVDTISSSTTSPTQTHHKRAHHSWLSIHRHHHKDDDKARQHIEPTVPTSTSLIAEAGPLPLPLCPCILCRRLVSSMASSNGPGQRVTSGLLLVLARRPICDLLPLTPSSHCRELTASSISSTSTTTVRPISAASLSTSRRTSILACNRGSSFTAKSAPTTPATPTKHHARVQSEGSAARFLLGKNPACQPRPQQITPARPASPSSKSHKQNPSWSTLARQRMWGRPSNPRLASSVPLWSRERVPPSTLTASQNPSLVSLPPLLTLANSRHIVPRCRASRVPFTAYSSPELLVDRPALRKKTSYDRRLSVVRSNSDTLVCYPTTSLRCDAPATTKPAAVIPVTKTHTRLAPPVPSLWRDAQSQASLAVLYIVEGAMLTYALFRGTVQQPALHTATNSDSSSQQRRPRAESDVDIDSDMDFDLNRYRAVDALPKVRPPPSLTIPRTTAPTRPLPTDDAMFLAVLQQKQPPPGIELINPARLLRMSIFLAFACGVICASLAALFVSLV